ncbi:hypothetical protein [Arenimonas sp.]|uniref:lipopolysaccharide biosynthesis protein n=1 Tax=Arenimonas sp. TaxID=1872635 RepID=UPI002E350E74|nr:hypothetical protein [Arenimonas sp.]HEX4853469.1 hypothetical protein [Arenimonas sp.]
MKSIVGNRLAGLLASTTGAVAVRASKVLAWNALRLGFQLVWAIALARTLGAEGYGIFSGVAGLAVGLSGLVGAGLGLRMYQDAVTNPAVFDRRWAQAKRALAWSGLFLGSAFVAAAAVWDFLPDATIVLFVAVAISELVMAPAVTLIAFGYAAKGRMADSAMAPALLSLARMVAAGVFLLAPVGATLSSYAVLHVAATALAVLLLTWQFRRTVPIGSASSAVDSGDIAIGMGFTSIWFSGAALGSFDKAAALHWGGAVSAGAYTASHRFASLLALPVEALLMTALPHLFKARFEPENGWGVIVKLLLATTGYGLLAGVALWWLATALPWILGSAFNESVEAARVLAWYLPVFCLRSLAANILLAFQQKAWRFSSEMGALLVLLVLVASWAPAGGGVAPAKALLMTEMVLMLAMWARVLPLFWKLRTGTQ